MARYWSSRPQEFVSQFVPKNLELEQGYFDNLQKKQDGYKNNISALNTDILSRQQDRPDAFNDAKALNSRANALKDYDINDPSQAKKAMEEMKALNFELGNYSKKNAYESRLKQEQSIAKDILENKDYTKDQSWIKDYQLGKLSKQNTSEANPVNYDPASGKFNSIKPPEEIPVVNLGDIVTKSFGSSNMSKDGTFFDLGTKSSGVPFHTLYQEGNVTGYGTQKVLGSLAGTVVTPDVIKYYQAKSEHFYGTNKDGSPKTNEADAVKYNSKGQIIGFNENTLLGKELNGYLTGKVGKERTRDTKVIHDSFGEGQYEKEELAKSLIGQTVEGQTYSPIDNDQNFKDLKESGVFKVGNDGMVKIDWQELNQDTSAKTTTPSKSPLSIKGIDPRKPVTTAAQSSNQKMVQLANQMRKMAEVTGFKGDIKTDNYEVIASAYNTLNKARLFGEQLSGPVSTIESNKITRNWELSTSYDPTNVNKLVDKPELKEDDQIIITERQTNKNGEIIKKGVIQSKDGTRTPIAMKSNSIEDSGYFDVIGNVGITSAQYQVGENRGTGKKVENGWDVISEKEIPNENGVTKVTTVGNPRDRSLVEYRVVTEGGQPHRFTNYGDLQKFLEYEYYTKVPEGKADAKDLLNAGQQYKTSFKEQ